MIKKILFILALLMSLMYAQTYRTEAIDGSNGFTGVETLDSQSGYTFYVTWDATNLYMGISGIDLAGGETWWIMGDVDRVDGSGGSTGPTGSQVTYNASRNTIYEPDFALSITSGAALIYSYGGTWGAGVPIALVSGASASGVNFVECSIPWASSPTAEVALSSFVIDNSNSMVAAFPVENPIADYPEMGWVYEFFNLGSPMPVAGYNPNNADNSLPVSLRSFQAKAGDSQVALRWSTASEVNNMGFIVERALAGSSDYVEIASYRNTEALAGQGNSNEEHVYRFTDLFAVNGVRYSYRLVDVDANGHRGYNEPVEATPNVQGTDLNTNDVVVEQFKLHENFPNPFNPETTIRFDVPANRVEGLQSLELNVFNSAGQKVKSLYSGQISAGQYELTWDGKNDLGVAQPSGVYFLNFRSPYYSRTIRMLLMK